MEYVLAMLSSYQAASVQVVWAGSVEFQVVVAAPLPLHVSVAAALAVHTSDAFAALPQSVVAELSLIHLMRADTVTADVASNVALPN